MAQLVDAAASEAACCGFDSHPGHSMIPPLLPLGCDSCYCKGWRWLVTAKLHIGSYKGGLSINASKEDQDKGAIPHKDYYPGDIIEDRYFAPQCIFVVNGALELYKGTYVGRVRKYRSIDDPWCDYDSS